MANTDLSPAWGELTRQQQKYVEARVSGLSASASARAIGVANPRDYEEAPMVRLAIEQATTKAMANLGLKREDVLRGMLDAVRASATSTELVMAWREIGKIIGAYEPEKVLISHQLVMPENLRVMSDSQLAQLAGMQEAIDGDYEACD